MALAAGCFVYSAFFNFSLQCIYLNSLRSLAGLGKKNWGKGDWRRGGEKRRGEEVEVAGTKDRLPEKLWVFDFCLFAQSYYHNPNM